MERHHQEQLLIRLSEHVGIKDVPGFLAERLLSVGGHDLLLSYDDVIGPDHIQFRLDLGCVTAEQQEWLWHRLLLSNFEWGRYGILGWGLTPEGDHVVCTALFRCNAQTTGSELADWIKQLVACVDAYWSALPSPEPVSDIYSLAPLMAEVESSPEPAAREQWMQLIESYCDRGEYAWDEQYLESVAVEVDGIDMLLQRNLTMPDRFEVRVDLGVSKELQRKELWQGLLWNNFLFGAGGHTLLSVDPIHQHIVLALQQDIPVDATSAELVDLLQAIAVGAKSFWEDVRGEVSALIRSSAISAQA